MTAVDLAITQPGVYRRFISKVDASAGPDGCHLWTASKTPDGYGHFAVSSTSRTFAHRWILGYLRGSPLLRHELALHHCDNPPCVNPKHLYVGDQTQNMRDCVDRGRANLAGLALGRQPGKTLGKFRTGPELCGTARGYSRHRRHGEPTCAECRSAIAAYQRNRSAVAK
jgi:hypothetical protein